MKNCTLFFALFCFTSIYSQEKLVEFQTELSYIIDRKESKWYLSKQNPELVLVKNKLAHLLILHDSLYTINFKNHDANSFQQPGAINYSLTTYNRARKNKTSQPVLKTDEQKKINDLTCTKFISKVGEQTYEAYIALDHRIDNASYFKNLIGSDEPFEFKGLIAEINIRTDENPEVKPFLKLIDLKDVDQCLYIDYSRIKESVYFKDKPAVRYSIETVEPGNK
jgi:hypothetical protein